jgi:hypothetical protein
MSRAIEPGSASGSARHDCPPDRRRIASEEELAEVLGVAVSVNAGAAVVYSTRALDAFDAAAELSPDS